MKYMLMFFFLTAAQQCLSQEGSLFQSKNDLDRSGLREAERLKIWADVGINGDGTVNQGIRDRVNLLQSTRFNNVPRTPVASEVGKWDQSVIKNLGIAGITLATLYMLYRKGINHGKNKKG